MGDLRGVNSFKLPLPLVKLFNEHIVQVHGSNASVSHWPAAARCLGCICFAPGFPAPTMADTH